MTSLALTLPTRTRYPPFLNKVVEIANLMLHYRIDAFEQDLHANGTA